VQKKTDSSECEVEVCETHYGHELELGHLTLSKTEQRVIANKRKAGIPKERVLNDIRESIGMYLSNEVYVVTCQNHNNHAGSS